MTNNVVDCNKKFQHASNEIRKAHHLLLLKNKQIDQIFGRVKKNMKMLLGTPPDDTQSKRKNLINIYGHL